MSKRMLVLVTTAFTTLVVVVAPNALAARGSHGPKPKSPFVKGIDVSHWNGTISWGAVAADGQRFAIAKATEGRTYADPTYSTNKSGATSAGLKFTGYHFARPDTTSGDATTEADHFVQVANLSHGNLIPALDLEVAGGLGVSTLQTWVRTWLARVATDLGGVKAMIYSSPSFWQTAMGNTTWFADNGYTILWIAHWTSNSSPTVPASNWGGHGWTFWQWTDCTHVNGISGCVDGDRYRYTDFSPVSIP
jgi:GH25 family lysozyme M1 (1,4-beta-N-acetylmuramidase)